MSVPVRDFLKNRRDRALGAILGHSERSAWWPQLSKDERESVRRVVIDALNGYHDSVLDLVKAEDANVTRNEEVIRLLEQIDSKVTSDSRRAATAPRS
jgi:hypothetical protein